MKRSIKAQLSLTITLIVLVTVLLISVLANVFINQRFEEYITKKQEQKTQEIVSNLSQQYNAQQEEWDVNFIHTIGMNVLYDGYIIKVYGEDSEAIWDAKKHDISLCTQVMADISQRMEEKYPRMNGTFTSKDFDLTQAGTKIGTVSISYYGPYFLSENDFQFLNALNVILITVGIFAFLFSLIIGWLMAKHFSRPITKTVAITQQIAKGNYNIRFDEHTKIKELEDLVISVNYLAECLNKQEGLRKQLTADVAHELRTPLTTISTHLEAMIEGVWTPTEERLQSCHEEINRISKLVKDLEGLARVESDNLKLNKVQIDIMDIIYTICSNLEIELKNKNLTLEIDGTTTYIKADKDRINQVILNLLSNAIKYTPDNGHIKIAVSKTKNTAIVMIKDNGIGIDQEELPFIFERFYRADKSRNRKTGGAGIGLAIVQSIINAHGGEILVESKLDQGSCFTMILPKGG